MEERTSDVRCYIYHMEVICTIWKLYVPYGCYIYHMEVIYTIWKNEHPVFVVIYTIYGYIWYI